MKKSKGARVLFVPYNGKIADITHADMNKYTLDLATPLAETREIIALFLSASRMAGTGELWAYPNEGVEYMILSTGRYQRGTCIIAAGTNRLQYSLSVANDDFDLYCFGYVVMF